MNGDGVNVTGSGLVAHAMSSSTKELVIPYVIQTTGVLDPALGTVAGAITIRLKMHGERVSATPTGAERTVELTSILVAVTVFAMVTASDQMQVIVFNACHILTATVIRPVSATPTGQEMIVQFAYIWTLAILCVTSAMDVPAQRVRTVWSVTTTQSEISKDTANVKKDTTAMTATPTPDHATLCAVAMLTLMDTTKAMTATAHQLAIATSALIIHIAMTTLMDVADATSTGKASPVKTTMLLVTQSV